MYERGKHTLATLSRGPKNEVRPREMVDLTSGVMIMYHIVGLEEDGASWLAKRVSYSRRLGNSNIISVCSEILLRFIN